MNEMNEAYTSLASLIDHALLSPNLTQDDLVRGCEVAAMYGVASVCIMPYAVPLCSRVLAGSPVVSSTTVGFPHGGHCTQVKVAEARQAMADGAEELDMVVNISLATSGRWDDVSADITAVCHATHGEGARLKVIFENCYLSTEQKLRLCDLCCEIGVDWVKTSTGFGTHGATIEDVKTMVERVRGRSQVKAAGGVRDLQSLLGFRDLGASRIGLSKTSAILEEHRRSIGLPPLMHEDSSRQKY